MKAAEEIIIVRNKIHKNIVPYKDGDSKVGLEFTVIKKGSEIPKEHLIRLISSNMELIGDVEYVDKVPINLPADLYNRPEVSKEMKIKKRKYTQNSLTKIYNDKGFSALKEIGAEFGVTDRSRKRLITEILAIQEERQRKGL